MYYFLIQNKYHAENFYPIADELVKFGIPKCEICFIHFDKIFKQNTLIESDYDTIVPDSSIKSSFYSLNSTDRLKFILYHKKKLSSIIQYSNKTTIIVGNDGAVQRIYISKARKYNCKTYLLLDGNLDLSRGLLFQLKKIIFRFSDLLCLSYLLPSIRGHTKVNKLYVMHECISCLLKKEGVQNITETLNFPRYWKLTRKKINRKRHNKKLKILYITSAFKWHSENINHHNQLIDIKELDEFITANQEKILEGIVRIHPRENENNYIGLNLKKLKIDSKIEYIDSLESADIVITTVSTMAYEAMLIGKMVYLYNKNIMVNKTLLCMGGDNIMVINELNEIKFESNLLKPIENRAIDVSSFIEEITL